MLDSLVKVTLPEMGESVTEGSIVEWRKAVGQWVDAGETLVDVTTDKVDVEVPATAAGVVRAIHGAEGDTVAVGTVLAEIDTTAEKPAGGAPAPAAAESRSRPVCRSDRPGPCGGRRRSAGGRLASCPPARRPLPPRPLRSAGNRPRGPDPARGRRGGDGRRDAPRRQRQSRRRERRGRRRLTGRRGRRQGHRDQGRPGDAWPATWTRA